MKQEFKCPMMFGMNMMYEPKNMGIQHEMPMADDIGMDSFHDDEDDERQFMKMYPESCRHIMVYVKVEIDIMEDEDEMLLEDIPDVKIIDMMTDNAYKKLARERPERDEAEATRQYPAGRFTRDLLRVLLLNELLKRRRRRRRMGYYGYPPFEYYDNYDEYDYDDYDYDDYVYDNY